MQNFNDPRKAFRGDVVGNCPQWKVSAGKRHSEIARKQHHDWQIGTATFREKLGVPGERYTRIGNHTFGQRRGYQASVATVETALYRNRQSLKKRRGVCRIRFAVYDGRRERHVYDLQAIIDERCVAHNDNIGRESGIRNGGAQLRPDTGRFAGRYNKGFFQRHI